MSSSWKRHIVLDIQRPLQLHVTFRINFSISAKKIKDVGILIGIPVNLYIDSFGEVLLPYQSFPGGASGKEPACQCRRLKRLRFKFWVWKIPWRRVWQPPWVGKIPWRRAWQPTPVFLPEESHGQRSPVGYSPCGSTESDLTERLSMNTPLSILSPSIHECRMDVFAFILIFFNFFQQSCVVSDVVYFLG